MTCSSSVTGLGRSLRRAHRGLYTLSALLVAAAAGRPLHAQLAVDHLELQLGPGMPESRVGLFTVKNEGTAPVQAAVRLEDWDRDEDGTNHWHPVGTQPGSCGNRLSIFPQSLQLAPGAARTIRVTLDSALGESECWAGAIVETNAPRIVAGRSVLYVLRTAVKIYAAAAGLRADGSVTALQVTTSSVPADSARPRVEATFANTGERHLVAHGSVEFRRPDNSLAARVPLPDAYVLPGAKAVVTALAPRLPPGRYVALALFDFGGDDIAAAQSVYAAP